MLNWVEHEKSFIISRPDQGLHCLFLDKYSVELGCPNT